MTNHRHPTCREDPIIKLLHARLVEYLSLDVFWILEFGIWSFYCGCSRRRWFVSATNFVTASASVAS
jgi:hypothetical protein